MAVFQRALSAGGMIIGNLVQTAERQSNGPLLLAKRFLFNF